MLKPNSNRAISVLFKVKNRNHSKFGEFMLIKFPFRN
jgi:hypothetical protein